MLFCPKNSNIQICFGVQSTGQKKINWCDEHFTVRSTCPKSESHNFLTRTFTVFAKSCFEIPKIIILRIFYNLLAMKLSEIFKCMTGLWCVMWERQSLLLQNRSYHVLSFEKKYLNFCIIWYHIESMVIFIPEVKCLFPPSYAIYI